MNIFVYCIGIFTSILLLLGFTIKTVELVTKVYFTFPDDISRSEERISFLEVANAVHRTKKQR